MRLSTTKIVSALAMMAVLLAVPACGAADAAKDNSLKMVDTKDVKISFDFTLADLAECGLAAMVPEEILLKLDPSTHVSVALDGKVHYNIMESHTDSGYSLNLHVAWHGTIALTINDEKFSFEFKNIQILLSVLVPNDSGNLDVKLNAHMNGVVDSRATEFDLSSHLLLSIEDGQLVKLKLWFPELDGLILFET